MNKMIQVFNIVLILLILSCSKNNSEQDSMDIVIMNTSDEIVYIGVPRITAFFREKEQVVFYLSPPISFDQRSIITVGPFDFDIKICPNEKEIVKIRTPPDLKKYYLDGTYSTGNIVYRLFYTKEELNIEDYNMYIDMVKNLVFTVDGNEEKNQIVININNETLIN